MASDKRIAEMIGRHGFKKPSRNKTKTPIYTVRYDDYGHPATIECNGITLLQLGAGSRNVFCAESIARKLTEYEKQHRKLKAKDIPPVKAQPEVVSEALPVSAVVFATLTALTCVLAAILWFVATLSEI